MKSRGKFIQGSYRRCRKTIDRWRKTMKTLSSQAQIQHEPGTLLVYFCPLNRDTNHFTLLEINEQERRIYHYDSMADKGVIHDKVKQTRVGKIVQVSLSP